MKPRIVIAVFALFCTLFVAAVTAQATVTAEAVGSANLRASPGTDFDVVGQIASGTRYPVLGRSEFFPWVLLADPNTQTPLGWVFNDLVRFQGDPVNIPISTVVIGASSLPTPTLGQQVPPPDVGATATLAPAAQGNIAATPAPTTVVSSVTGTTNGEINVRYGPGTEYDRLGVAQAGETFAITGRHTQFPWVQIAYAQSPNGFGWVANDLLAIQGNLDTVQQISQTTFFLPTLTPTASVVDQAAIGEISPEFAALGAQLWENLLNAEFDPLTQRLGALYLTNLNTGETIAFDSGIAFSGTSINKIAILAALFRRINDVPDDAVAQIIAQVMVCSETISSNRMLALIGDGNPYTGAERVSQFLQQLGLNNTFIYTPFSNDPFITPQAPAAPPHTEVDQVGANPDPYNQMTVTDIGALLRAMYQCATTESGPFIDNFDGEYTPMECRKMLDIMTYNHIHNFIEAGVPEGVRVAHKHGWVNETHGDAGIVFSPGGDYIFVIMLHNPGWLVWDEANAVISESSRDIYNYFNPNAPLDAVRMGEVPECNLLGNQGIVDLLSPTFGSEALFR